MAIYHVLLNGSGTSGNGSTWNDDSSGTAAYIGQAGLSTIFNAAVANDVIYIKGTDTTSTGALTLGTGTDGADFVDRPVRVIGCKSATTNTGVNVDNNDVIPGLMTGDTDEAWNDGDMPYFSINSASADLIINHGWWYGVRMKSSDNINMVSSTDQHLHFEECWLEVTGTGDYIQFGSSQGLGTITGHHSKFLRAGSAIFYLGCTHAKFKHCTFSSPSGQEIFDGANNKGFAEFDGCTFLGGVTTIISLAGSNGYFKFNNVLVPLLRFYFL